MCFSISQKVRVRSLRVALACVVIGLLVTGGYVVKRFLSESGVVPRAVELEQKIGNLEVRHDLPPERTFLGKMSDEKDGVTRVQVRGRITRISEDRLTLSVQQGCVRLPASVLQG